MFPLIFIAKSISWLLEILSSCVLIQILHLIGFSTRNASAVQGNLTQLWSNEILLHTHTHTSIYVRKSLKTGIQMKKRKKTDQK